MGTGRFKAVIGLKRNFVLPLSFFFLSRATTSSLFEIDEVLSYQGVGRIVSKGFIRFIYLVDESSSEIKYFNFVFSTSTRIKIHIT